MSYSAAYLAATARIAAQLDPERVEALAAELAALRDRGGRLFIVGNGGGAGHASHAVNDFRKICGIEAYTPTDNVSELTARINDDGWENSYVGWLEVSHFGDKDLLLVFSVGGGDGRRGISRNLVRCVDHARAIGATVCGIVGRDGGHTARHAKVAVVIPTVDPDAVTAHTEGWQSVVWHLLVGHPSLRRTTMKWESVR